MNMSKTDKRRVILTIVLAGLIFVVMVVMTAYAAELRCENNELIAKNKTLQGEVDTLGVKIKASNNVAHIEKQAKRRLGMVYPTSKNCVYLKSADKPERNFAALIKKEAYN